MDKNLLLIGGGGHCKSVLDSLLELNQYSDIGIIDVVSNVGKSILGIPIIGCDNDLLELFAKGYKHAFVTIGSIGDPTLRINLFAKIRQIGFEIPIIIDPTATVSQDIYMDSGTFIGKNAVVSAGSKIGEGSIINTASVIEHDCRISRFTHIAPGSVICGGVEIGENTHIGSNSVIKQQVRIGSNTIIGMGSVVLHDIPDYMLAYGNPCKEVQSR